MEDMATIANLIDRVRLELADQASTFDVTIPSDGVSVRYELGQFPLDAMRLTVQVNGTDIGLEAEVEERTGTLTFDVAPLEGATIRAFGSKYRYFTNIDITQFVNDAFAQHTYHRADAFNRAITLVNLPIVEEYPLALLATCQALYALLTDASFDIDIHAPDGVSIPRSERYRQLTDMLAIRKNQYEELCAALNVGLNRIEVFQFRRVSRTTNRLVPVYIAQEIDDRSQPQRVYLPVSTLGAEPMPMSAVEMDLVATQGDSFSDQLTFPTTPSLVGAAILVQIRTYPDSPTVTNTFTVVVLSPSTGLVELSLTPAQTKKLPLKSFWDAQVTYPDGTVTTVFSGSLFSPREITRT